MWDTDLPVLPGSPHADVKVRLLEEWLRNPFLDEDLHLLEQRLGAEQTELRRAIDGLCRDGVIRAAGARGYMLDSGVSAPVVELPEDPASHGSAEASADDFASALTLLAETTPDLEVDAAGPSGGGAVEYPAIDMSGGLASLFPGADVSAESLAESLPFGVVVLRASGALEMANRLGTEWLGITLPNLDAATFEIITGVNPLSVVSGAPVSFSLHGDAAVEVCLYPATLDSGDAVLAVLRDVSLQEEVSHLQAEAQEELFARLSDEMVGPLGLIEQFLDHPDTEALSMARAAMEQINGFLRDYYLRGNPGTDPEEDEPPCQI